MIDEAIADAMALSVMYFFMDKWLWTIILRDLGKNRETAERNDSGNQRELQCGRQVHRCEKFHGGGHFQAAGKNSPD